MSIDEVVIRIIEDQLHVKVRGGYEELEEMGADSLDVIELMDKFEETFDIKLEDEMFSTEITVKDVIKIIKEELQ